MRPTDFAVRLTAFLTAYLAAQRNVSPNTVKSYRDAFTLLLRFLRDQRGIRPEKLTLNVIDAPLIVAFLEYLEKERGCKPRTRNQRLAALHSFFRYLQAEDPSRMLQAQRILAIRSRRHEHRPVPFLPFEDLGAILAQPDTTDRRGRRDAVLLSVLYDTAARCQEIIDLRVRDVRLDTPAQVRLLGKGRKERNVPLMPSTVAALREYLRSQRLDAPERVDERLFQGRHGGALSRSGVRYILAKYATGARAERPAITERMGPHTLRHSKAMHLLQAGIPLPTIRDLLGQADIKTTEIYARANMDMKRRALEKGERAKPGDVATWRDKPDLMAWLRAL
jgi:site-specific recombinase XerD